MTSAIPIASPKTAPRFTFAGMKRGLRAAWPFILSNGFAGIAMGVAYKGLGIGFVGALMFSSLVYSATAQAVTLGLWAFPPPIAAMMIAMVAMNSRYLIMSASLRQLFGGLKLRRMIPALALFADASWLMSTIDSEKNGPDAGYLIGCSLPMATGWIGGTLLGFGMPLRLDGPFGIAAMFFPLIIVATLLPSQWRGIRMVLPWVVSAVVALAVTHYAGAGWGMLAGGGSGTIVSLLKQNHA